MQHNQSVNQAWERYKASRPDIPYHSLRKREYVGKIDEVHHRAD